MLASGITLAIVLAFAFSGPSKILADTGAEISQQAAKLNHRGLDQLHKKEYEQAIASFREALQLHPEFPEALDNLGKALEATGKDGEADRRLRQGYPIGS